MINKQRAIDKQFNLLFVSEEKKESYNRIASSLSIKPKLTQWDLKLLEEKEFAKLMRKLNKIDTCDRIKILTKLFKEKGSIGRNHHYRFMEALSKADLSVSYLIQEDKRFNSRRKAELYRILDKD